MSISFDAMRAVNAARADEWHRGSEPWTCADWSNALCGEAGEAANFVKKIRRIETGTKQGLRASERPDYHELVLEVGKELADVVLYADLLAYHFGIDLGAAVAEKFNEVSDRYGFDQKLKP